MKKNFCCLLILIFAMVLFSSCSILNGGDENTTTDSITSTTEENRPPEPYAEYFDWDYQHKPTNESVRSIINGMSIPEVVEIIGKPHRVGPLSGLFSLEWQTEEGNTFRVVCAMPDNPADDIPDNIDNVEAFMKYGVAARVHLYEENPFGTSRHGDGFLSF